MYLPNIVKKSLGFLALTSVMTGAMAESIGVIAVNGVEKIKVSRCGPATASEYLYTFVVQEDGTWDFYDYFQDLYLPSVGTYAGTLQSRKMNLSAGSLLTSAFVSVMQDYSEFACGTSLDVVSNTPLLYKVKINKNLTTAKATAKFNVRGYSPEYGRYGTAKYTFSGSGTYGIESL